MIRASDLADAICAITDALNHFDKPEGPNRIEVRKKLIRSRVDLEMALRKVSLAVHNDIEHKQEVAA